MKYFEMIDHLIYDKKFGFCNVKAQDIEYKLQILDTIRKAKCSIVTVRVFIGFVELNLKSKEEAKLSQLMDEAFMFIANGCGLEPIGFTEDITQKDLDEMKIVNNWTDPHVCCESVLERYETLKRNK